MHFLYGLIESAQKKGGKPEMGNRKRKEKMFSGFQIQITITVTQETIVIRQSMIVNPSPFLT